MMDIYVLKPRVRSVSECGNSVEKKTKKEKYLRVLAGVESQFFWCRCIYAICKRLERLFAQVPTFVKSEVSFQFNSSVSERNIWVNSSGWDTPWNQVIVLLAYFLTHIHSLLNSLQQKKKLKNAEIPLTEGSLSEFGFIPWDYLSNNIYFKFIYLFF